MIFSTNGLLRFWRRWGALGLLLFGATAGQNPPDDGAVLRRLVQLQSASVDNLTLHLIFPTPDSLNAERWFHHFFFRQRINGEWFRLSESDLLKAQTKAQEATHE